MIIAVNQIAGLPKENKGMILKSKYVYLWLLCLQGLHLDLGDELDLATTTIQVYARYIIFYVSLEQFDV